MSAKRSKIIAGVVLGGLVGGVSLGSALQPASAGTGDPPVIVLPSAKAAPKSGVILVQATAPAKSPVVPALELLPPPQMPPALKNAPLVAPPLLAQPEQPLRAVPSVSTVKPKEAPLPPPVVAKEAAPVPRVEPAAVPKMEVLPPPAVTGPVPSPLATPGDTPMRTTAAALTALIAASPAPATEKLVIEKITDYAKADDVQSLKLEIEALKKQLTTLAGTAAEGSKATDVKALKTEIETLKKEIGGLTGKMTDAAKAAEAKTVNQVKAADVASLKDEIAVLKKEITALSTKPVNKDETDAIRKEIAALAAKPVNKDETDAIRKEIAALAARPGMKDDVDALRKDVATLNVFLRETLEGKVERGFTHEGLVKRLQKLDDSIDSLSKKMATLAEPRTAGSSPLGRDALTRTTGTVHIVNDYAIEISIVVNGMAHRLEPNTKKDVAVVGGSFKYQLLTNGGIETERSIKDNETITLTIR